MSLRIERITEAEAFEGLGAEWRALERELSPRLPFSSPLWHAAWWKHLRRTQLSIRDEFYFHTVRENGALVAVAPLMISETPGFGRHRYRHLQFVGADLHLTELRGVVCREADEERVLRALSQHLACHRSAWHSMRWSGVRHAEGLSHLVYAVPKLQAGLPADTRPTPELKAAQRAFFALVYRLLIGGDTGPRLPTLLLAAGPERVRTLLGG